VPNIVSAMAADRLLLSIFVVPW